jgi:hypothetical protein
MGDHHKSNKLVRQQKYASQFARTTKNKNKRIQKEKEKQGKA